MTAMFQKSIPLLIAQARSTAGDVTTTTTIEYDFPPATFADGLLLGAFAVVAALVVWLLLRDSTQLGPLARGWLVLLRLSALAGLLVIAINPHQRTQEESFRPSQVMLLVDTSTSMQQPAGDPSPSVNPQDAPVRWEAVRDLLANTGLIEHLRESHVVDLAMFDSDLRSSQFRFPVRGGAASGGEGAAAAGPSAPDWIALLEPTGLSTRLGDSLDKLLAETRTETLAGVVVLSDGASNVGRDVTTANRRAQRSGVPLFAVGVGGKRPPVNLQVARLIVPTDVQLGDAFELTALVQSQGFADWREQQGGGGTGSVNVQLLRQGEGESEPVVVESQPTTLAEDGVPVEVTFSQSPAAEGEVEYSIRVESPAGVPESRDDDNQVARTVNVFDRPTRLLVIAGGPMRDYRFSVNALHRHPSMQVDVWLQSADVGISQNAHEILYEFPTSREALFGYDVALAFDVDWSLIPEEGRQMLTDWVANEGGGLVLVAGDVFTPQLAASEKQFENILKLYPVVLDQTRPQFDRKDRWNQPWKLELTPEGQAVAFLQIADDAEGSRQAWDEFPGIYRAYPTLGRKGGASVYAYFSDPLSRSDAGQPVVLASQRYGQGVSAYIGSPELWRLRSLDEDYFDRFWIKLVRMAAEGRSKRGLQRGMLVLDGSDFGVGQTVPVRARVLTASFEPLETDTLTVDVYDPRGRPVVPAPVLKKDSDRPSEFSGDLRVTVPGKYRLELPIPDSSETVSGEISVTLPRIEMQMLRQDVATLEALVADTGGAYLAIEEAAEKLPELLVNKGQTFVLDERVSELWDRRWVMFLLIGLLSAEWLSRKLMKLA
jgi:hypothetical protein